MSWASYIVVSLIYDVLSKCKHPNGHSNLFVAFVLSHTCPCSMQTSNVQPSLGFLPLFISFASNLDAQIVFFCEPHVHLRFTKLCSPFLATIYDWAYIYMLICRRNNEIQVTISFWGMILVLIIYDWVYLCVTICIRNNESSSNHFNLKNNMSSKGQQHFCQWHSMKTWT
jgi:hypothetical protein